MAELSEKEKRLAAAREAAREKRIQEFAAAADARPAAATLSVVPSVAPETALEAAQEPPGDDPAPESLPDAPEAAHEADSGLAQPSDDAEAVDVAPEAAAPAVAPSAARAPRRSAKTNAAAPWANAHPRLKVPFTMQLSEERHLQLTWLKENLPNTSIAKILAEAVDIHVAKLLRENYR